MLFGILQPVRQPQRHAQVVPDVWKAGIQAQRRFVSLDRPFGLPQVSQRMAQKLMCLGTGRPRTQDRTDSTLGLGRLVQPKQRVRPCELEVRGGFKSNCLTKQTVRHRRIAQLQCQGAKRMQRVSVPRCRRDHLAIDLLSLCQPASHMHLLTLAEEGVDLLRPFVHALGVAEGGRNAQ